MAAIAKATTLPIPCGCQLGWRESNRIEMKVNRQIRSNGPKLKTSFSVAFVDSTEAANARIHRVSENRTFLSTMLAQHASTIRWMNFKYGSLHIASLHRFLVARPYCARLIVSIFRCAFFLSAIWHIKCRSDCPFPHSISKNFSRNQSWRGPASTLSSLSHYTRYGLTWIDGVRANYFACITLAHTQCCLDEFPHRKSPSARTHSAIRKSFVYATWFFELPQNHEMAG